MPSFKCKATILIIPSSWLSKKVHLYPQPVILRFWVCYGACGVESPLGTVGQSTEFVSKVAQSW